MAVYSIPKLFVRLVIDAAISCSALTLLLSQTAFCQDPIVDRIDATNLSPGQKASVVVSGKQIAGAMSLWTPVGVLRPKEGSDLTADLPVTFEGDVAPEAVPGIYPARMVTSHGCSEAAWVVVDDLPRVGVTAESDDKKSGQLVTLPCCIGGQINPVAPKFFRVALSAGQAVSAEVFARRLGSELDPLLRVTGPDGVEVAYQDDLPGAEGDTQLQFTAVASGEYRIEVRDVRYSGGPRHFFHLRLGKFPLITSVLPRVAQTGNQVSLLGSDGKVVGHTPQSTPTTSGSLTPVVYRANESDTSLLNSVMATNGMVQEEAESNNTQAEANPVSSATEMLSGSFQKPGDSDWFRITATEAMPLLVIARTRELGCPTDVLLELYNAEGGKMGENDDTGLRDAELAAQFPAAGEFFLKVSEIAGRGGSEWAYALELFAGRKAIRVTAPADRINVPRGGSAAMPLTVRRIHYDGPLMVEAVGLPAALTMAPITAGSRQSTVPLVLTASNPAAVTSDADWASVSFRVTALDGAAVPAAELQLTPPPPKKTDAEIFRSARLRTDLFAAVQPAAQFSFSVNPGMVTLAPGASATIMIKSTRAADWTMPIEIALATPADQLPPGITVTGGSMAADELSVTITAAADAASGPFTVFLQGKAKKDAAEPVHPVPPIVIEVKTPSP